MRYAVCHFDRGRIYKEKGEGVLEDGPFSFSFKQPKGGRK